MIRQLLQRFVALWRAQHRRPVAGYRWRFGLVQVEVGDEPGYAPCWVLEWPGRRTHVIPVGPRDAVPRPSRN